MIQRANCRLCGKMRFINKSRFCFWCYDKRDKSLYQEIKNLCIRYRDPDLHALAITPFNREEFLKEFDMIVDKHLDRHWNIDLSLRKESVI